MLKQIERITFLDYVVRYNYLCINRITTIMKRILLLALFLSLSIVASAQNVSHIAINTNGPMGEILFHENENGDIVYTGVVETPYPADTVLGLAREYMYTIEKKYNASVGGRFEGVTKVACDVELPVGTRFVNAGLAGTWAKAAATVNFNLVIDIRPGKYRYTLTNFVTDRWRIPGEGKDKGQSNVIHWQRVNSLQKELEKAKKKDKEEIAGMIEKEKVSYEDEYKAVMFFIDGLKSFAIISDVF